LFVGVEIDRRVASAAAAIIRELQRRTARLAPAARVTWPAEERLHMTVRFIGNADAEGSRAIASALEPAIDVAPFELTLGGIGAFPGRGAPRVIWAGVTHGREPLQAVEQEVTRRLTSVGVAPEHRPYSPHLTLARVRDAAGLRSLPLFDGVAETRLGTTRVEAITLFESRLSPQGPTYVPLQQTALRRV
jgi:2'-5' RNA ligase